VWRHAFKIGSSMKKFLVAVGLHYPQRYSEKRREGRGF